MRRRRSCAIAAAVAFALAASAAQAQPMPSAETLARQFEAVAFSSEFGGAHRGGRLIRWQGPIVVRISGRNSAAYRPEVEVQLAELRRLSGLAIELPEFPTTERPANFEIEFSRSRGGTTFDPGAPCRTLIYDRNFVIQRVTVFITPEPNPLRRHCIAEELTQALGLANDSPVITDSIFNDNSRRQRIAPWDAMMVRILYDSRLSPGMAKPQALPLVRAFIAQELARPAAPIRPTR
jgi:hypothetical protein